MVTNTGGLPILFTSIDDKLKYGSTTQSLTLDWSSTSTNVFDGPRTNLFTYSNELDDGGAGWSEMNGTQQDWQDQYQWNIPLNEPYYFNSSSGVNHNQVNTYFPTDGFGNTRSTYNSGGNSTYSGAHSIGRNDGNQNRYLYKNVTLSGNTTYTISVYAAARNSARINDTDALDRLRFAYRRSGGSDVFSPYQTITNYISPNSATSSNWRRYYWTFSTTTTTTYSVGIVAPNLNYDYTALWGIQLEKGSVPTTYIYTRQNISTTPSRTIEQNPAVAALPTGKVLPTQLRLP